MKKVFKSSNGHVALTTTATAGNQLTALPSWAGPLATNITVINVEDNDLRHLPTGLPPSLTVLRLGGNPITGDGIVGAQKDNLIELLQNLPHLETVSVGMSCSNDFRRVSLAVLHIDSSDHSYATCKIHRIRQRWPAALVGWIPARLCGHSAFHCLPRH